MLNSKQRAYLMSMASKQQAIFQVGKASLTPEIISSVDAALEKRELVKISVLKNCFDDPKEIAQMCIRDSTCCMPLFFLFLQGISGSVSGMEKMYAT